MVRIAIRVGTGWLSAVGVTQHLHRELLRRSSVRPREVDFFLEITQSRPFPWVRHESSEWRGWSTLTTSKSWKSSCMTKPIAMKDAVPPLFAAAKFNCEAAGFLEIDNKKIRRSLLRLRYAGGQDRGASWLARCPDQISAIGEISFCVGRFTLRRPKQARPDSAGSTAASAILSPGHVRRPLCSLEMDC